VSLEETIAAAVAAKLEPLCVEIARLARAVASLNEAPRQPAPGPRLLSLRQAARELGVSRTRTLPELIKAGRIRVVTVNGKPKVSVHEIERVAREGTEHAAREVALANGRPRRDPHAPLARDLV
jgi:hypothetical protein